MDITFFEANNYCSNKIINTDHQESLLKPDYDDAIKQIC